jgi:hypothetical protein
MISGDIKDFQAFPQGGGRAGCFGYGENKQKGDNEGGYLPSQQNKLNLIIPNENRKSILFYNIFYILFLPRELTLSTPRKPAFFEGSGPRS